MKAGCLFIVLLIFIAGCTSEFDKEMKLGKSSLKEKDYANASLHLENALIEKPSDKDAQLLLTKSNQELADIKLINDFKAYTNESQNAVVKFIETKKPQTEEETKKDGSKEYRKMYDNLLLIKKDIDDIGMHYQNIPVISDMHKILQNSIDDSITEYGNLLAMTLMIEDETKYDDAKFKAYGKFVSNYSKSSNETLFKYVNATKDFKELHNLIKDVGK